LAAQLCAVGIQQLFGYARDVAGALPSFVARQQHSRAYVDQIKRALDEAFALFEQRLAEHEQPGSQLTSARAMFDLWIEVAEEAYAKVAMSEPFQQVYASLGNAQMRLRAGLQREVEQMSERIGLPTRSEMDAAHRRIAELERSLRRLQAQVAVLAGTAAVDPVAQPTAGEGEASRPQGREEGRAGKEGGCQKVRISHHLTGT
ncbi:hypothetical protein C7E18_15940, partial [Stenotrophomonas maltophilia]